MFKKFNLVKAIILVFLASACTMVLELIAGRILAPYIGVSLYTWTSIIGIVLAGISLGNYLGGKIGDKFNSPVVLSIIFCVAAVFSLTILPITMVLEKSPLPTSFHVMSRTTIYTFALFFLPTAFLGMVTPIVIKLMLKDLGKTANVVGTIYAISCVGSILGTFLTGFFLISWFGTRVIVWQVAGILFILGIIASDIGKSKVNLGAVTTALAIFILVFAFRGSFQTYYTKESNYYAISVYDDLAKGRPVKSLALDHLIHSYVDLNDPKFHGYGYEESFAAVAHHIAKNKPDLQVLMIGGGGYSFPRYLEATFPEASIEVLEIDPAVTQVAHTHLGLPANTRIVTHNGDARIYLIDNKANGKYDLVAGDAFNDTSVPYHLTTLEFNEKIKGIMAPNGFYIANLIDELNSGQFVDSFMKTLEQSFKHVYIVLPDNMRIYRGTSTYVLIATNGNFNPADLTALIKSNPSEYGKDGNLVTLKDMEQTLGKNTAMVLTDDHVPVDNMLAPFVATR